MLDNEFKVRLEADTGICVCLGIVAIGIVSCVISNQVNRSKRDVRFKEIEYDLRKRHANSVTRKSQLSTEGFKEYVQKEIERIEKEVKEKIKEEDE